MHEGSDRGNKERKKYLEKRQLIRCGHCPYNRGENAKRKAKSDYSKTINRDSIRKLNE